MEIHSHSPSSQEEHLAATLEPVKHAYLCLYFTRDNLSIQYISGLKRYLLQIVDKVTTSFIISVVFEKDVFEEYELDRNINSIQNVLSGLYTIFEPEYSKNYALVHTDIILPQVFDTPFIPPGYEFGAYFYDKSIVSAEDIEKIVFESEEKSEKVVFNDITKSAEIDLEIEESHLEDQEVSLVSKQDGKFEKSKYKVSCLGGTFDHLHLGHKLLLTNALFYTSERVVIGITGSELLGKKAYAELIQDFPSRKARVESFINLLTNNKIKADIYELKDPCGPAGTVEEIECLILTPEVAKGGDYCNNIRQEKGLTTLDLVFVDMVLDSKDDEGSNFSNKTSSSKIRQYLAEKAEALKE
ncbi:unnamed protein product [Moneuplotes crassus]|uniref:Cytidyltransferase-like domain-containing protein n=1 Tax=Euplotes crassus TaxID=5936 RepID=A0AAD2CWZ7_EUPCR|nr:unnamed protein product [Moneuplotes crassus]